MNSIEYFRKLSKTFQNSVLEHLEYMDTKHLIIRRMKESGYDISEENIEYHIEDGTLFFRLMPVVTELDTYIIWVKVPLVNSSGGLKITPSYITAKKEIKISESEFSNLRFCFDNAIKFALEDM